MAIEVGTNKPATAYHIVTGAQIFPYAVDALHAVSRHPLEWSATPWTREDAATARQRLNEVNKAEGNPPVPDLPALSPADQKALDEHNKAVADAEARLKAYYAKKAEDEKIAAQVAADEALVASMPPQPDTTVRRPLSPAQIRKAAAQLSPEEQKALADKKAMEDAKAADLERARRAAEEKAHADKIAAAAADAKLTS